MTIVYGQIESLKRIKNTLAQNGIARFNSIGDLNDFSKNYEFETQKIFNQIQHDFNCEIAELEAAKIIYQEKYDYLKNKRTISINNLIKRLSNKCDLIEKSHAKNSIKKTSNIVLLKIIQLTKIILEKNSSLVLRFLSYRLVRRIKKTTKKITQYTLNREEITSNRCVPKLAELAVIKNVVDGLNNLIAGAIGENLVVNEIKKLTDEYVLINDYRLVFNPPMFNKEMNDRIHSIQIDHLVISKSGVFILETKNWSKKSIESLDLRSPVEQINRTSYVLFVLLNRTGRITLNDHHWGEKKIPIYNVIVLIHEKPKVEFKFVKVKTLNELNSYLSYRDSIFNENEVQNIAKYLLEMQTYYN